jgi:hypothetical protein
MNGTLILSLATLGAGVLGLIVKYGFKSKCSDVNICFGLCLVHRDIENEVKSEEIEITHDKKPLDTI